MTTPHASRRPRLNLQLSTFQPILILAAVALAAVGTWRLPGEATSSRGLIFVAVAVVLAIVGFRLAERTWPRPAPAASHPKGGGRTWQIAAGMAMAAGLILSAWALSSLWRGPFTWAATGRWALGLLLLLVGAYVSVRRTKDDGQSTEDATPSPQPAARSPEFVGPRPGGYKLRAIGLDAPLPGDLNPNAEGDEGRDFEIRNSKFEIPNSRLLEAIALVIILLVALWFRAYKISQMPPGIFIDETNTAMDALRILEGRPDSLFGTGWFESPNGFTYLQTLFIRLFGTTFFAIKIQSILPGMLTVLALYFLGRELFGPGPGLFGAAFLAFNRWHFNMSRWGWAEVYPSLMHVLAVWFILRGARRRSWGDWALAGLLLGLGMYTYLAIRLSVIAIGLYLLYRIVVDRGFLRANWPGLIMFAVVYALTFAPLAFTYIHDPFTFLNRSQQISIFNDVRMAGGDWAPLKESALRHLRMFSISGDFNARHNLPGAPMLDVITGAFFMLGLGWSAWKWRDHRRGLLLIWAPIALLGGILSQLGEAPQAFRTLTVTPAVALFAADAYDLCVRGLFAPVRRFVFGRWLATGLAVAGLVAAAWLNFQFYFQRQAPDPSVYVAFSPLETQVAREVVAKRADSQLYLSPRLYYFAPLRFLAYEPIKPLGFEIGPWHYSPFSRLGGGLDQPGYKLADPTVDLPIPDLGGANAVFLLDEHFQHVLDLFRYFYPGAQDEIVRDRLNQPLYLRVTVPGAEISALQAHNRADQAGELRGLYIPASGQYSFSAQGQWQLDGQPLPASASFLGKGLHTLELVAAPDGVAADSPALNWEGPAGAGPVPDSTLFRKPPSGNGLRGQYFSGEGWQPPVLMQRIDPLLLTSWPEAEPIFGPFSATWTGELLAPANGPYNFVLNADDGVRFWLDGQLLGESVNPDTVNMISVGANLTAGPHPIRIDYFQRGGGKALELFWLPPGQPMQPVAPQYLRPD